MDAKQYISGIEAEKGLGFADVVKAGAVGVALIGMIGSCDMDEDQRADLKGKATDFLAFSMAVMTALLRAAPSDVQASITEYLALAQGSIDVQAKRSTAH